MLHRKLVVVAILMALEGCAHQQPRIVTRTVEVMRTQYVGLDPRLLPQIEAPTDPARVDTNGALWRAWVHDSRELGTCKPALDGIRALQPHAN